MEQPPVVPSPSPTPPATGGTSSRNCLVAVVVAASAVFAVVCLGMLTVVMLPLLSRAPKAATRAECSHNLKMMGIVFKMYAGEQRGRRYPPLSPESGRLMFQADSVFPEYMSDPQVLVCPSVNVDFRDWFAKGQLHQVIDDHSYIYLGHVVRDLPKVYNGLLRSHQRKWRLSDAFS